MKLLKCRESIIGFVTSVKSVYLSHTTAFSLLKLSHKSGFRLNKNYDTLTTCHLWIFRTEKQATFLIIEPCNFKYVAGMFRTHSQRKPTELRSCVKVEVDVLGSPSLTVPTVSVDVKQHWTVTELRRCVKVEVAVRAVSVDVTEQHHKGLFRWMKKRRKKKKKKKTK